MRKGRMKKGFIVLCSFVLLFALAACGTSNQSKDSQGSEEPNSENQTSESSNTENSQDKVYEIGINQYVTHASLDAARQGFIDALKENGFEEGKNVKFDMLNAEGSPDTALTISQKFASEKKDLIFAIATPSAQASAQATTDIPILITAVTDPVSAGLVDSIEKPGGNVTGTTDMNPVKEQLALVSQLTTGTRVGLLYNTGETNSEVQVNIAKEAAKDLGLTLELAGVTNSSEVKQAAESLVGKIDAFYIPTDNTVVSALDTVVAVAESNKLPVVVGEGDSVKNGGLITYGLDYYKLGYQTGEMAIKVLKGEAKPADMPIETQKDLKLYINETEAKKIGITIPQELLDKADEKY